MWAQYEVDAFVVVYSITDRRSFQKAADLLDAIRSVGDSRVATILVANKSDLVRSRIVGEKGASSREKPRYYKTRLANAAFGTPCSHELVNRKVHALLQFTNW